MHHRAGRGRRGFKTSHQWHRHRVANVAALGAPTNRLPLTPNDGNKPLHRNRSYRLPLTLTSPQRPPIDDRQDHFRNRSKRNPKLSHRLPLPPQAKRNLAFHHQPRQRMKSEKRSMPKPTTKDATAFHGESSVYTENPKSRLIDRKLLPNLPPIDELARDEGERNTSFKSNLTSFRIATNVPRQ